MSEKLSKIDIKDLQTAEVIQKVIIPKLKNIDQDIKDLTLEVLTRKDDAIKAIEETGKEFVDKIKEQVGPQGGKGDKGDKGESYLLTSKDKREIAKLIDVPVVDKIIEKVEVIVEKPTVTNNEIIKEVAKYESPEEVTKKINTLSEVLEMSTIKGLKKLLSEIVQNIGGQVAPSVTRFISIFSNGTLSKSSASEINFGPNMTVTATPNGVFVDSASGGGGGSSTYTGLTDAATADLPTINTPLSNALASKATPADISTAISNLVDTAPATLNTLNELAAALGDDPNFATTITTQIGQKENSSNKATTFTGNTTSNTLFPTIKAVYDWATATFSALSHTHTAAQVTDFNTAVSANTDVTANTSARHTHANQSILDATTASFTTTQESKLSGIQTGAEVNVNADWNATSGDAQILNKPATMPPSAHTHTINDLSDVVITGPTTGQVIKFDGTNWINDADSVSGGGGGVTDHGALTGLGDDDHTQYHNDARGDARYYTKSEVDTSLSGKVTSNIAITGATKTKITYDAKGLVTAGGDATTADIADSTNKRYVTDAQLTVIGNTSNTNTGDETTATIKSKLSITTLSGSNTGDQTSIVGITGTTAQFNTALTDNDFATLAGTETLTNKKIVRRVSSTTSTATLTPTYGTYDDYQLTAQAAALTIANPTGTPSDGEQFIIRVKDNATARAITFGTAYRAIGVTLPTTTTISKTVYIGCKYNATDTKVDVIALAQEA